VKVVPAAEPATTQQPALIEHGLDFIGSAVELLRKDPPNERDARLAVVHLAMGVELVLKARLYAEHWSLVLDKIEGATKAELVSGKLKTVGSEYCVSRRRQEYGRLLRMRERRRRRALRRGETARQCEYALLVLRGGGEPRRAPSLCVV
jgi:hypothetical protein